MSASEIINWTLFAFGFGVFYIVYSSYQNAKKIMSPMKKTNLSCAPDDFHLAYESVTVNTVDGKAIKGWFIPAANKESSSTIIFCHGWGSNRSDMLKNTYFLAENYNLCYFDFRGCGESKSDVTSIGYLETRDFDAIYSFVKNNRAFYSDKVAVMGLSMGGSVAIYGAAKYPEINAVVAESAFLSMRNVVANWGWGRLRIPCLPYVPLALYFVRKKFGTDPELYSPLNNAAKVKMPILFICGDNDDLVPQDDCQKLYDICGSENKENFIINGCFHAKCAEVGGVLYKKKLSEFFEKFLN